MSGRMMPLPFIAVLIGASSYAQLPSPAPVTDLVEALPGFADLHIHPIHAEQREALVRANLTSYQALEIGMRNVDEWQTHSTVWHTYDLAEVRRQVRRH